MPSLVATTSASARTTFLCTHSARTNFIVYDTLDCRKALVYVDYTIHVDLWAVFRKDVETTVFYNTRQPSQIHGSKLLWHNFYKLIGQSLI